MTLIDDLCDGCGGRFDPMGDPLLTRHPEISEWAVYCATCERKTTTAPEPREDVRIGSADVSASFPDERDTAVAEVIAAHEWVTLNDGLPGCRCGWINARVTGPRPTHRAHVAEALAPLIAERVRAAAVEALREAADEIERELICCDVYERRDHAAKHHICYWGGAARALVLDRADRRADQP